ncbi:MAG: Holliday junction DNA helicase, subunit A [Candidatus Falkowbacteria bacterium GW2011_GWC2_38_22]|uniref:Holliday junction branch migration complex subunit RuvA n=1 Tax=Candidatus Falkowbacteria bacterium GW2011_GWE1_38_31 TaxID=1618638 RepID=A0A0G0JUH9_9BACT|nr:MAG: Holliday junction DNA helicase, subunit A [Candidatus Falkowbacteria bacterium GW2011_GWF2_38_1205]KKQ61539.1 MAG: Holliday junction DNA helicase, subunit A [Candidatus Falkowbacteria bacterium GW2011_GWC2_38_22]KKQ63568.1 MAG: Holliday junction DNA helicase, subunit A [Candidatus Falkowbacteria bacterium GW2011_GWF1_38_22]KKQ65720.1 MAG: Holliday junction DNA helicase, subunit A [Candidatus Falkowbacteria bacterium GW2011_GWE2_38_254]KKQ70337.1 MAG: Holliday junction DNA helicase, subu
MIAYLRGKIQNKQKNYIILNVRDIGYLVFVSETIFVDLEIGQEIELYIHQHIREDAHTLYGFKSLEQLEMFELLLTISGIGPKSALAVIGIASVDDIKDSISRGDSSLLIKVSGIGKKTAERVVLDLRDKIAHISHGVLQATDGKGMITSGEEIDALMALGYSMFEARDVLRQVDPSIKGSGERIRAALRLIGR